MFRRFSVRIKIRNRAVAVKHLNTYHVIMTGQVFRVMLLADKFCGPTFYLVLGYYNRPILRKHWP